MVSGGEPTTALSSPALTGIRRLGAVDTVRARLAMAIDLGLLEPAERLPAVPDIADALAVSEITVRRALTSLAREGVLVRRRGRGGGTLVAPRPPRGVVEEIAAYRESQAEVHALIDHRRLLDVGVAHLAARSATSDDIRRLAGHLDAMDVAQSWTRFHLEDERFHVTLAEIAGPAVAVEAYRRVLSDLYRFYLPYPLQYLRRSNAEHRRIADAVAANDPAAAAAAADAHVEVLHRTMFVGLVRD